MVGGLLLLALTLLGALAPLVPVSAAPPAPQSLQAQFAAASAEFQVPEPLLLAVSYNLSRWEHHRGAPSVAGGYGPMHLIDSTQVLTLDGRGLDPPQPRTSGRAVSGASLMRAAQLLDVEPELLKRDQAQNLRGGAALLADMARATTGRVPSRVGEWYGAVAAYSGSQERSVALDFADLVYATIRAGAVRTTSEGLRIALQAQPVVPNRATARSLALTSTESSALDCPSDLACAYLLAAYLRNDQQDPSNYGNFDLASRPADGLDIQYIVIHNTEINYNTTIDVFRNPERAVSSHYLVRAVDGQVVNMVRNKNVAWHAGNWYINSLAIGIEHEGVAIEGAAWYSEAMYRSSARLVRYLALRYGVPLDRAHIIGHDEIPGPTPPFYAGMHWDPGPFWDWAHYMELLGAPLAPNTVPDGRVLTISPDFGSNQPAQTYCYDAERDDCRDVPQQPANFVYLRSAPDPTAPLLTDPYISSDATRASNLISKAMTGQQFYRLERRGDWDAIFFGGHVAWLYNPGNAAATPANTGLLIRPRPDRETIPVFGRAYPEAEAYPPDVPAQALTPIYEMPAGQLYVATDLVNGTFYAAPIYAPSMETAQHQVVAGQVRYYRIFFNHRFAFVRADDVETVPLLESPARSGPNLRP